MAGSSRRQDIRNEGLIMECKRWPGNRRHIHVAAHAGLAAAGIFLLGVSEASAYVGAAFVKVPGVSGGWKGSDHKDWLAVRAHYWKASDVGRQFGGRNDMTKSTMFSGPAAPAKGPDDLVVAIDKKNPAVAALMARCASKTVLPELAVSESSEKTRSTVQFGSRPDSIPAWFEYKLKNVEIRECPVVAEAPEQAFVLHFSDIQWLNYNGSPEGVPAVLRTPQFALPQGKAGTKAFVISWIGYAHDGGKDHCEKMNSKPEEADYYTYMTPAEAAKERASLASEGKAIDYGSGQMGRRGPGRLNVCKTPGIVRDPGFYRPKISVAQGIDLDGNDGNGPPPKNICKHTNYTSPDGRKGIDNQLFAVTGCVAGYQGRNGFGDQYANEERKNGYTSFLIAIAGIDNEVNDDSVDVYLFNSDDDNGKGASGAKILPDYSFRPSERPQFANYRQKLHGKIVNGVIVTDPVDVIRMHLIYAGPNALHDGALRLEIKPDGRLRGTLGGYVDWRSLANGDSQGEQLSGLQYPALYNALKGAADGMKDPVTGECNGISMAYDIEGEPAFIAPQ
jgi:type VI protein secretion system component Hcp